MPELPEVETVTQYLKQKLEKKVISKFSIINPKLRYPINSEFNNYQNLEIKEISRRAKYIIAKLANKKNILIHLGMTGNFYQKKIEDYKKHDHFSFILNNQELTYNDTRKFGFIKLLNDQELNDNFKDHGLEPFGGEISANYLLKKAANRKQSIKDFLLSQKYIVGIGNIYACEILFKARIHPQTAAKSLTIKNWQSILTHCQEILRLAIKSGGSTIRDFAVNSEKIGYFAQQLLVYGRQKKACRVCNSEIKLLKQGGRTTFYCEVCQKK
jgi:formamidopyrimidine-DNA glycosylase